MEDLKRKIERLLSDILSDKYDCKVKIEFVPANAEQAS